MHYSKKNMEPVPEEEITVWACSQESCVCWMRENFSFNQVPLCPICKSEMVKQVKMLPVLTNHNHNALG
ncbi:cold-shock protein [Paenibacillus chitinolyticus]|uniref:Cold-shock protein n=1 Tax=Paenibacillus chitinolyticus TaxID=79263 RepID=A0A410WRQ2_9BACL|nr:MULTISPECIES: cold-shock protein [Paenibacillus]EGL16894.1 hypothetical protein HMPREF9413_0680 [Paenibacillus sp. HGF7]EPD83754.1 hypothetical protein HMPREF1207_03117 [Paenibacillus sp. HGH0039]MBV6716112.1 cold-shock protein [Paenibacillus chitinolyticus]MCY9593904.1 cold-shock protein [Paenibacillus chitinolyticus]MCY9598780.1 cold-shock protein [Paenibacillus chitinolyticus]